VDLPGTRRILSDADNDEEEEEEEDDDGDGDASTEDEDDEVGGLPTVNIEYEYGDDNQLSQKMNTMNLRR
jgi:hypothetical protein